jgi:pimeloyl-ACP methyl ester carboxylesterase
MMSKIPVYFMPGLAASTSIFENIQLDKTEFEMFLLEWKIPNKGETLQEYAKRMCEDIKHENPVLVGVSFGGILVQEMNKIIPVRKTIIISSVKCNKEFPRRIRFAKVTKLYKLIPIWMLQNVEKLLPYVFEEKSAFKRTELYHKYFAVRDTFYLKWSLQQVLLWDRSTPDADVIHIHGDKDEVFPIKYIKNCNVLEGGTHIMIVNKFRWLNEKLAEILKRENV